MPTVARAKRLDVEFDSHGTLCRAWLYLPAAKAPAPVIVMAHGLGAVRTMRLDVYAQRFSEQGYACLAFDYRCFGDSEGRPRQLLDIDKQLQDWRAAAAFVRSRTDVDAQRVVLWGTSFSGGHVLSVAAEDAHVAAVIAQCPFTDGLASSLVIPPLTSIKLAIRGVRDQVGAWLGREPLMTTTAGEPGATALMTAPDAMPGYLALVPPEQLSTMRNEVAARFALQIMRYFPGRQTARLACPALFCVCQGDSVAPAKPTLKYARRAPQGEIKTYYCGHFDIYVGAPFEQAIGDQLDFLARVFNRR